MCDSLRLLSCSERQEQGMRYQVLQSLTLSLSKQANNQPTNQPTNLPINQPISVGTQDKQMNNRKNL